MKKILLATLTFCLSILSASAVTVFTTAGNLMTDIQNMGIPTYSITELEIMGNIDQRDFEALAMGMNLFSLTTLDLSFVNIDAYSDGTNSYPANCIPENNNFMPVMNAISTIILPSSITSIGKYAFNYWPELSSVSFPLGAVTSLEKIDKYAFSQCEKLTNIEIPNGITEIAGYAFNGCTNLETPIFPYSLKTIGAFAYGGCMNIKDIVIPETVDSIGMRAFSGSGMKSLSFNVPHCKNDGNPFCFCDSLSSLTIGNNVKVITDHLFAGPNAIKSITIPPSVEKIGLFSFASCKSLKSITIPSTVDTLIHSAFSACDSLNTLYYNITNNPDDISGPFSSCPIKKVVIGNNVTRIPYAFLSGNDSLETIVWGSSLKEIGYYAFKGCNELDSLTIPSQITKIGLYAFYECKNLSFVQYDAIDATGYEIFNYCSNPATLVIGDNVKRIANGMFSRWAGLTEVSMGNSLDSIGYSCFRYCENLETINWGQNVSTIDTWAFADCPNLSETKIPESITTINQEAFMNTGLTQFSFPASVKNIGSYVLRNCSMDSIYYDTDALPNHSDLYSGYKNTRVIEFGPNVETINSVASAWTGLKTIRIAAEVDSIVDYAFSNCTGLAHIYANKNTPIALDSMPNVFKNVDTLTCILHVPVGSVNLYKNAAQWKSFLHITDGTTTTNSIEAKSDIKASVQNGLLKLSGLSIGETITIYNLNGLIIYSQSANSETELISLTQKGIYIVKLGQSSIKVIN